MLELRPEVQSPEWELQCSTFPKRDLRCTLSHTEQWVHDSKFRKGTEHPTVSESGVPANSQPVQNTGCRQGEVGEGMGQPEPLWSIGESQTIPKWSFWG